MNLFSIFILNEHNKLYNVSSSITNEELRSCEQTFIKLDNEELKDFFQNYLDIVRYHNGIKHGSFCNPLKNDYTCIWLFLHFIYVFRIPGQEDKRKIVQDNLKQWLQNLSEETRYSIYKRYISQRLKAKSNLTDEDLLTCHIDPQHELELKLVYFDTICLKNDNEGCKEFLRQNMNYLVSNIEEVFHGKKTKTPLTSCKILLCLLNWNICNQTPPITPINIQNTEIQVVPLATLEADTQSKDSCTQPKLRSILQNILSTLSEDETITTFKNYLDQMHAMKSEITEEDFCTNKIDQYHEFQLKLCYCEKLCNKMDIETYKIFLRRNADLLVPHIEKVVEGNQTKWKFISCKILLYLLNWNICVQKTTPAPLTLENTLTQACPLVTLVSDTSIEYSCTVHKVNTLLEKLLSTLSADEIFTVFNNYLDQIFAMKSEITEDDLCTGKINQCHEFQLKLCYCEKLCNGNDSEFHRKFLKKYDYLFVYLINVLFNHNKTKIELVLWKILMCLSTWYLCNQKTTLIFHNIQSNDTQTSLPVAVNDKILKNPVHKVLKLLHQIHVQAEKTEQSQQQPDDDLVNDIALFCVSMVDTVMTRIYIPALIKLCDALLSTPENVKIPFNVINDAVTKLVRFYANNEGIDERTCEWILFLAYKYFNYKNHKKFVSSEEKKHKLRFFMFLHDLFTEAIADTQIMKFLIISYVKFEHWYNEYHIKITDESQIKQLWIDQLISKVKAIQFSMEIIKYGKTVPVTNSKNETSKEIFDLTYDSSGGFFIDDWEAEVQEDYLKAKIIEDQLNEILQSIRKSKLSEMLVFLMMLSIVGTSNGHHKSAKLKKYLTLKYEYHMASLYLLWCSGDVEVHPGPCLKKKSLAHDSSIERRWIQNISPKIIIRLPELLQSKYKPTKKVRNDKENKEYFKTLLKTCLEKNIHVPKMYLAEINAWETMEYKLLHKLFVYRCEIETIIASLQDFPPCGGSTKDFTDINVSFDTELETNEIAMVLGKDQRPKDISQLTTYITRHIAGIAFKCAHGKDPDAKCDGLWNLPLKNWPKDVILFDPNNRGKYRQKYPGQKLISDFEIVDILISLSQVTIPQKYTHIVDAYKLWRKSQNKQHKVELCSTFKRTTSLEKINYALTNLCVNGILTEEVHNILKKWWTIKTLDTGNDKILSQVNNEGTEKKRQPHISINISTKSITLTVEPTSANSSQVSYDFPFNDELVPLKTMTTTVSQTTIQKPSSDSYQKVAAKKYLTVLPKPDACPADIETDSIIIPQDAMTVLNSYFASDLDPNSNVILESKMSSQETALCSSNHLDHPTSTKQFSQSIQNIAISEQPGPILCTPNQSTTNSDDLGHLHSSDTNVSQNLDMYKQVSPISDMGSSDSISSVNSEPGNEERDQNNTSNGGQVLLTDSDYTSDSSNNCVSKTNMKKRKCVEEDRNEIKKRIKPSLKQDKKQKNTDHRKIDSSMDNSTTSNKNMELLLDCFDIDLDSFDIDDQTLNVELNTLDNDDKNPQISDKDMKDGNLKNGETLMLNENTSVYNTNVSTELEKFLHDMIDCEG